jgi:hypothetical protein
MDGEEEGGGGDCSVLRVWDLRGGLEGRTVLVRWNLLPKIGSLTAKGCVSFCIEIDRFHRVKTSISKYVTPF